MVPFVLSYVFAFAASGMFGPLVPAALLATGFSASAVANAVAAQNVVRVVAPTLWGQLADRSTRPALLAAASFACAGLCHLAIIGARTDYSLITVYAVLGFVGTAGIPIVDGLVLSALEDRGVDKSRFGSIRIAGTIGFALSTFAVGVIRQTGMIEKLTPPSVLFPAAALVFVAAATILTSKTKNRHASGATVRFFDLAKNKAYVLLLAFTFCHWASHATYTVFVVPLGDMRGLTPLVVALSIVLGLVVEALLMRRAGEALARIGGKRALVFVAVMGVVRWLGFALHTGSPAVDSALFLFFSSIHGLSFGFFYPVIVHLISEAVPDAQRHSALSVMMALAFGLGGAAGAAASGHLLDAFGPTASWLGMIPFSIAAICLTLRL